MTSNASICSVTRMVPILEVIKDPTFPARIIEAKVGANSKIMARFVAKPMRYFGMIGLSRFKAVWIAITPPTKKAIKATIPQ